jgi:hypothetical protein
MKYRVRDVADKSLCGPWDKQAEHKDFCDDAVKFITSDINIAFRHRYYMDRDNPSRTEGYEVIEVDE